MKTQRKVLTVAILALGLTASAISQRSIPQWSITSGGASFSKGTVFLSGSVGQPFIGVIADPQKQISQGIWRMIPQKGTSFVEELQNSAIPTVFSLMQNYPNPFNPLTTIRYGLPQKSPVTLSVYNTLGQLVQTLVNDVQEAGYHQARFGGSGLVSGVYFYRLQAGSYTETRKLVLLK